MRELAIFTVILAILVTILGGVISFFGGSFGLNFAESWYLALIALVLFAPAILNIHIFANPSGAEGITDRMLALIRGLGLSIAALACAIPVFTTISNRSVVFWSAGIGLLLNLSTLPLQFWFEHRRRQVK